MTDDPATLLDTAAPSWRADIDALAFRPDDHSGVCMVHRHAFRTLMRRMPGTEDCLAFYRDHVKTFQAAAAAKLQRIAMAGDTNFHLTSRDLARQMAK
ncbi:MAG: hypothetical protein ABWY18_17750 [Tardiphaga sp.]